MFDKRFRTLWPSLAALLLVGATVVPAASADTKMVMKSHTDAYQVMGQQQPAQDTDVTFWIGDDRAARSDGETAIILRPDQKKVFVVNHENKTYSVLDLPVDMMAMLPEASRQQMEPMMKKMEMTATVEPTGERKEINGWSARLYNVSLSNQIGMKIASKVWASTDVGVDLGTFREMSKTMASLQPGFGAAADKLLEIEGVPVLMESDVQMMGSQFSSNEELVSASNQDAPAGTYEVPEGYTEQQFNPMGQGQ